jgi:hypothetical protein
VYDAEIAGERWTFGTSGYLRQSNKLMYDRKTRTLWQSITGEPVIGKLAYSGIRLKLLPVTVATWADWLSEHPDTTVLSEQTGFPYRYEKPGTPGSQYLEYYSSPDLMFPSYLRSGALRDKSDVFGLEVGASAKAYPVAALAGERVVNDTVGGLNVVIVADGHGGSARAYSRGGHTFSPGATGGELADETGAVWLARDDRLTKRDSPATAFERIPGYVAFWFGWYALRPHTEVYQGDGTIPDVP